MKKSARTNNTNKTYDFYSKEDSNKQANEGEKVIQSGKNILSFWASDSLLAMEYFHRKLNYEMLEFIEYGDGLCTMCFAPIDESPYLFYVHFCKIEESLRNDEMQDEEKETNTALHLIPTTSSDIYSCDHLGFRYY